ncbi:MAG: gliding motility-associated C-terminal domain-containing protein, partial [Bacteroidales bacterium]|nr:gliding motility-associated C-terminal domain-containing protein [Bacteroidales bacterium]
DVRADGNCPNNYTITRTWTATDECNNSSTAVQVITVEDNIAPSISDVPGDATVSCNNVPAADPSAVTVTDNCSASDKIIVTVNDVRADGNCPNNYAITRTWTATDECGNSSTAVQVITVQDNIAPVITGVPANTTVSCDNVPAADASAVTVTDNCSASDKIAVTVNDVRTDGNCPNNYVITRTWTATDECGNSSTAVQVITVEDNVPPVITGVPVNTSVSCDNVPAADASAVTVTDNCSASDKITVTVNDVRTDGNCPNNYIITRTWTATDECGNPSTVVQVITVQDNVAPSISNVPGNTTISCDNVPAADASSVTVTDNCSASDKIIVTVNDVRTDGNCPNNYVITRTWTAIDECGNSSTAVQIITVEDNVAPVISNAPGNTTVSCDNVPAADPSVVTVSDNCSTQDKINVTVNDVRADGNCPNNYTITRTWTATDECGNSSTAVQVITVEDNVAPSISDVPGDATVSCNNVPAADPSTVTVTDNCSASDKITVTVNDVRTDGNCPNNYAITRTWTATDECGNSSTAIQVITVQDNTAPVITGVPANTTVSCDNVPAADPSAVTVTDNCSASGKITVTVNDVRTDGNCPNNYIITRTWTATDECGNSSTVVQVITVQDNTAPVIGNVPVNTTVSCDNVPVADASVVTVTDNCSTLDKITVTVNDIRTDGNCPNNYTITRTWIATDECGNQSSAIQVITVQDIQAPTVNCIQKDTVYLNESGIAVLKAEDLDNGSTDNCSPTLSYTIRRKADAGNAVSSLTFDCNDLDVVVQGYIPVLLFVTDECGNTDFCEVQVLVQDKIAPQAKCSPVTINLDATGNATLFPSQIDAVSADNCGIETYSIKYGDDGITAGQLSFDCSHVGKDNYVTLIVADKSGNKDSCTTVVTVQYANNAQPDPTVSPQNQEICSGDNAQLTLANYYGAGNYDFLNVTEWNWIVTKPSGITGNLDGTLTAGSSLVSQTLTNSIDTVKMLKYSIVPTIYGKCILDTVKVSVWVNPQPKLWAVADTSICNNTSTKIPVYTKSVISSGADVYYGWTAAVTGLPADSISGYIDSGQEYIVGTDLGQTLNNSSYSSRKVKYTLQPSLHLNNRVCPSPGTHMEELNVTVEPTPVVSIIASQDTICNRTTIDINVATKNRPEGQWYSVLDRSIPGNVTIPDVTIPPSTGQFTQEINNTSLSKEDILYTFQPRIKTRNDQVCAVSNDSVLTVTVNPTPVMAADFTNHLDSICFKSGTGLNMESSNGIIVGDLKYDIWDVDFNLGSVENVVTPGIYNFTDGQSGRRAIIDQSSLWNKSSSVQEVTYSVSPAIRYNSLFCSGDTVDYTLYIAPELLFDIHADTVIGGHNVSCYGYDNGRIHVENVVGGWVDNGYSYEWSVAGNDTRTEINQLEAGGYDIIIKDRTHGCASDRKTMVLTQPDELTVIVDVQNPSCLGPTGSIVLTVEGGTRAKGYQYSWEGPEYFTSTDSSNHALRSGLYEIKITDVNGCFLEIERELPRVPSPVPSVTWNESNFGEDGTGRRYNISCHGASDGRMNPVLSVQRIVVYTWEYGGSILKTDTATSGNYFTLNDMLVNNLSAGVYNLSVEDEDGCLYICPPQTIREPSPVVFTSSVHQYANGYEVQCHGTPTGRISISGITGGYGERYGPYEYDWIPKDKGIQDGSPNQTSLYAGDFSVLVRNKAMRENGTVFYCDTSVSFTLKEPDELSVQATIPQYGGYEVACYGQSIGKIDIDVSGGYGNHTYFWTSNDGVVVNPESRNQDNLPAGTYNLAITYGDGVCSVDKSYTLHQPDEIKPRAVVSPITCNGKKDGEIRIDPEGGLPGYTYAWRSPDVTIVNPTQQNQSNLEAGTYWLIITDAGSCVKTTTYEILEPSPITSIIQAVDPTCIPGNDGSITLDPTGGTPGYTFVWSNGQTSKDINGLSPGDYSVVISDMNACTGTAIATINQPVALQVGTTVTSNYNGYGVDCYGRSTGKVDIDIQHGRPPYTYQWYSEGQQVNIDPLNIPSGNYEVEIMDHFNCSGKDNFVITQPEKMRMYATVTDLTCAGGENGSIQVFINGGLTPYKYDWSNGANTALLTHLHSGEYSVRITDNNDCSLDTTIALKQPDFIDVQFDIVESFCPEIADGEVRAIVSGGTPQYTYYWPQLGATSPNLTDVKSGSYVLEVTDAQDCKVTATVEIGYRSTACLKIPNAFSPNDDGINDRWEIMAGDPASFTRYHLRDLYPEVVVEIYSANWGMLLYRSQKGYPEPWDGKYNGKYLPVNSYFYVIRLRSDIKPITGNVTIIR